MSEWSESNPIDYSPNGDDIDRFAQKTKAEFAAIYALLNLLRRGGASAGLSDTDAEAYSTHIDTTTGTIYMRDGENKNWFELGHVAEHFGLTPEDVGAVKNGGGIGAFYLGTDANKNNTSIAPETYDVYMAYDTCKLYVYYGGAWHVFLSLNFSDMLNVEDYVIVRNEVAYSGKDKVLRLDSRTGKGNIDITGSPGKLLDKVIFCTNLHQGDVLMYDEDRDQFINKPKDEVVKADITFTGEIGKIPAIDENGKLTADVVGSPSKLLGYPIEADFPIEDDQVLAYDQYMGAFVPRNRMDADSSIANKPVRVTDLSFGQVLMYDSYGEKWVNRDVSSIANRFEIDSDGDFMPIE